MSEELSSFGIETIELPRGRTGYRTPDRRSISANVEPWGGQLALTINAISVEEDKRGQGTGRQIYTALEHEATTRGATMVRAHGVLPQARGFWEKLGFHPEGDDKTMYIKEINR